MEILPILTAIIGPLAGRVLQASSQIGIPWHALHPAAVTLLVFSLRALDLTLATLRLTFIARGQRTWTWVLGFLEALTFVVTVSGLLANLKQPVNLLAYAAGFATGTVLGILIAGRFRSGHSLLRVVSPSRGLAIQSRLHSSGTGATILSGRGMRGAVNLILSHTPRQNVPELTDLILDTDPEAYVSVEDVRQLHGGWKA
jgi:uncharacterized protein YebE (UPF0316 family)